MVMTKKPVVFLNEGHKLLFADSLQESILRASYNLAATLNIQFFLELINLPNSPSALSAN